eukprot:CAMPEP_0181129686 /NCGR_PEP_ID=MMETSP1071-20121207/29456_1 /TAXON_ID=35127 /ORGANISM="Thalassiosira sp., Strain NH16" /LENGTH=673 /DNA_ID=CAMNT_0023215693 /DNA_START=156 /DNA_END=2177 /DNA_ORIENTATION=+
MHCSAALLTASLALVANAGRAQDDETRLRGLGASQHEYVSATPLTFDVADPEPVDRERLLAEAEIEGETDWMDEFDFDMEDYEDMGLEDMDEFEDYDADGFHDIVDPAYDGEDYDDMEEDAYEEPEDEDFADSTYVSENGVDFSQEGAVEEGVDEGGEDLDHLEDIGGDELMEEGEGSDELGEAHVYSAPITRRLRRVVKKREHKDIIPTEDQERYLAEKESFRDDSIPDFEPILDENGEFLMEVEPDYDTENLHFDEHGRALQSACGARQKRAKVQIITDNSGWENSWEIRRSNGALVTKGPRANTKFGNNKQYIGAVCLNPGTYRFIVKDLFNDGMCGTNTGKGLYRFFLAGSKKFTSPANCNANWRQRVHQFTVRSSNPAPAPAPSNNSNSISGRGGCSNVKVQFKVDKHGRETTVTLAGNGRTHLASRRDVGAYQTKTMQKCLPPGSYTLRLQDQDGICCSRGQGWYRMYVNGIKVISGGAFVGSKAHTIKIGSNWQGQMSSRAKEWLNAHNSRRRKYNGGRGYVPMRWSRTLASQAKSYADRLGNNCNGSLVHAKGIQDGENLAKNSGSGSYAKQYTADQVMGRWVENEMNWSYPRNAHMTQVVWRSTQYVGCGESARSVGNGKTCRIQVCRYARPGNCNVRNGNWRAEAWKDDTGCGRACPSEGCFV